MARGGGSWHFLEHSLLLMNENLIQSVRKPIVADFG
jgi:hypothetical protein